MSTNTTRADRLAAMMTGRGIDPNDHDDLLRAIEHADGLAGLGMADNALQGRIAIELERLGLADVA